MNPSAVSVLRRHGLLLLVTTLCASVAAGFVLLTVPERSTSTTVLRLDTQGSLVGDGRPEATEYVERLQNTFTGLMASAGFRAALDETVGDRVRTSLELSPNNEIMEVVAESTQPALAVRAAEAGARLLVDELRRQQDERVLALQEGFDADASRVLEEQAALRQALADLPATDVATREELQQQLDSRVEDLERLRRSNVDARLALLGRLSVPVIVSPPSAPTRDSAASGELIVIGAALIGLLAGAAAALVLDRTRRTFASGEEAASTLGLPLLADLSRREVRRLGRTDASTLLTIAAAPSDDEIDEAARMVLARLRAGEDGRGAVAVLTDPAEPVQSMMVAHVAVMAAVAGEDVVLVDADGAGGPLGHVLGTGGRPGLLEVVDGRLALEEVLVDTAIPGLSVLPRGGVHGGSQALVGQSMLHMVVKRLARQGSLVLVSRRATPDSEVVAWTGVVDGVVLALCPEVTRRRQAARLTALLQGSGVPVLGLVSLGARPRLLVRHRHAVAMEGSTASAPMTWGLSA